MFVFVFLIQKELQHNDRKLLRQFIEIRFRIESLGSQLRNWTRTTSLSSYRDLSTLGTLPRSPTHNITEEIHPQFRQRALSLRASRIELSPSLLRHSQMQK
jgi:hypothetical protein